MCRCQSLSVYVQSIKVTHETTWGGGLGDAIAGLFTPLDDVSFGVIATGTLLSYPPNAGLPGAPSGTAGTLAWPSDGSIAVAEGGHAIDAATGRVRVATVVPFGSGCDVALNAAIVFFEKDWDTLQELLELAMERAVELGILPLVPAAGLSVATQLINAGQAVLRQILNLVTGLRSERMGEIQVTLPVSDLDDPRWLDQLPWGAEMRRDNMTLKTQDSFVYSQTLRRWGGTWDVELYFERTCTASSSSGSSGGGSSGGGSSGGGSSGGGSSGGGSSGQGSSAQGSSAAGSSSASSGEESEEEGDPLPLPDDHASAVGRAMRMLETTPPVRSK